MIDSPRHRRSPVGVTAPLLLLGSTAALRRSELVARDAEDVCFDTVCRLLVTTATNRPTPARCAAGSSRDDRASVTREPDPEPDGAPAARLSAAARRARRLHRRRPDRGAVVDCARRRADVLRRHDHRPRRSARLAVLLRAPARAPASRPSRVRELRAGRRALAARRSPTRDARRRSRTRRPGGLATQLSELQAFVDELSIDDAAALFGRMLEDRVARRGAKAPEEIRDDLRARLVRDEELLGALRRSSIRAYREGRSRRAHCCGRRSWRSC